MNYQNMLNQIDKMMHLLTSSGVQIKDMPESEVSLDGHIYASLWAQDGKATLSLSSVGSTDMPIQHLILANTVNAFATGLAMQSTLMECGGASAGVVCNHTFYRMNQANTKHAPPGQNPVDWPLLLMCAKNWKIGERMMQIESQG